jgi:hypothetical protein
MNRYLNNKEKKLITVLLLNASAFLKSYTVVINNYCSGEQVMCKDQHLTINSAGDLVSWELEDNTLIVEYGKIQRRTNITAEFPQKGNKVVLSFIFPKAPGMIKNKLAQVLFVLLPINTITTADLPESVRKNLKDIKKKDRSARTLITVYRRIIAPSSKPDTAQQWTEITTVGTPALIDDITVLKAEVEPTGMATVYTRNIDGKEIKTVINLAELY